MERAHPVLLLVSYMYFSVYSVTSMVKNAPSPWRGLAGVVARRGNERDGKRAAAQPNSLFLSCLLFLASCFLLPISCFLFLASCFLPPASCLLLLASCFLLPVSCFLFLASCFLLPVSCFLFLASCFLFPVSCFLFLASCFLPLPSSLLLVIPYR